MGFCAVRTVAVCAVATASVAAFVTWRFRRSRPPRKWVQIGEVSHLLLYPLKSGKAVETETVECTSHGVKLGEERDRMFLVVDSQGKCKSGREYPKMIRIVAHVSDGRLLLSGPDAESPLGVELPSGKRRPPVHVQIWQANAEGIDCGDEVARWLSRYLLGEDSGLRLLYRAENLTGKEINPGMKKWRKFSGVSFGGSDAGLFSDTFSYHLISQSSVDDLNGRIADGKITPLQFRPNIVVKGEKLLPYEEDRWRWVKIGDVVFQYLAPCMRCSFTTLNPESAEKDQQFQPITAMKRYRMMRDSEARKIVYTPMMGVYLGLRQQGTISVGDGVFVPERDDRS